MKRMLLQIAPLAIIVILLMATAQVWASMKSVELSNLFNIAPNVIVFPLLFAGNLLAIRVIESIWRVREFVEDETGQVNLQSMFQSGILKINPMTGIAVSVLMGLGIIGSSNLVEVYRLSATDWHDQFLWNIEEPLFFSFLNSWLNMPTLWSRIYFMIWPGLFLVMALILKANHQHQFLKLALGVVIAFYLTRYINLLFPTAGPVFFKTELFSQENTLSVQTQEVLRLYMMGHLPQNGLIPGTMAMPSLHVGLVAMAAWFLAREWRWTLWLTMPWLLLVWMSTIMLGWHYALDGIGGILVVGVSVLIAHHIYNWWHCFTQRTFQ